MASSPDTSAQCPRLVLPCEDSSEWSRVVRILSRPLSDLLAFDAILTDFSVAAGQSQSCKFFSGLPSNPDASAFDLASFWARGAPLMVALALEMPTLFAGVEVPLLLPYKPLAVTLTRRQVACLLAHSAFGSITASARTVAKERWAFRAAQMFFLEASPSALCLLNYFKQLALRGFPEGGLVYERVGFPRRAPPWDWSVCARPLCPVVLLDHGSIEDSPASTHCDFANKFVGGGALENDAAQEEILFALKPELIVTMALCSYLQNEEVVRVTGAASFSRHSGYGSTFRFEGDWAGAREGPPPTVVAMDALQGCARIQFGLDLVCRDLHKARIAFEGAQTVATGNWGCGAFGNDHTLKFLQQWLAASEAGVACLYYHTYGDKRAAGLPALEVGLRHLPVGRLWDAVKAAAAAAFARPWPEAPATFREHMLGHVIRPPCG